MIMTGMLIKIMTVYGGGSGQHLVEGWVTHSCFVLCSLCFCCDHHFHAHQHHHSGAWRRQRSGHVVEGWGVGARAHSCGRCGETLWVPTTKPGGHNFYIFVLLCICTFMLLDCVLQYYYRFVLLYVCACVKTVWLPTRARGSSQGGAAQRGPL